MKTIWNRNTVALAVVGAVKAEMAAVEQEIAENSLFSASSSKSAQIHLSCALTEIYNSNIKLKWKDKPGIDI